MNLVLNCAAHGGKWTIISLLADPKKVDIETLAESERSKYEQWKNTANTR